MSLEDLAAVAAAAYEAKVAADAAAEAVPQQRRRLSLVEALEETLILRLSTEAEVERSLASITQTLLLLQRQQRQQQQQQPQESPPESPLLREAIRFGK